MIDSDSSSLSDSQITESEESTNHRDIKREKEKLIKINKQLSEELASIRKQFEQALSVSNSVEEVYNQNAKLLKEQGLIKAERDDLARRLQISLQANSELTARLEEECAKPVKDNDAATLISQQKQKYDRIIEEYKAKNNEQQMELNSIYQAATQFYGMQIHSSSILIKCLTDPLPPSEMSQIGDLSKQLKKSKKKIARQKEIIRESQRIIDESHKLKNEYQKEADKLSNEIEHKLTDMAFQLDSAEKRNQEEVSRNEALSKKNEELIQEISKLRLKSIKTTADDDHSSDQVIRIASKLKSCVGKLKQYKLLNQKLQKEIQTAKSKLILLNQFRDQVKKSDHKRKIAKQEAEESIKKETDMKVQVEKLNSAVSIAQAEVEHQREVNMQLSRQNNAQADEIRQFNLEKEKLSSLLKDAQSQNQVLDRKLEIVESDRLRTEKSLQEELRKVQLRLKEALAPIDTSDLLPVSSFRCPEFPKELIDLMSDVIQNTRMQAPIKVQNVLSLIGKWYNSRLDRMDREINSQSSTIISLRSVESSFRDFMASQFPELSFSFDENSKKQFANIINGLRQSVENEQALLKMLDVSVFDDAKKSVDEFHNVIKHLNKKVNKLKYNIDKLNTVIQKKNDDEADYLMQMKELETKMESYQTTIKQQHEQITDQKNEINTLISQSKKENSQNIEEIHALSDQLHSLQMSFEHVKRQKKQLAQENEQITQRINQLKDHYKGKIKDEKAKSTARNQQTVIEMKRQRTELENALNESKNRLIEYETKIAQISEYELTIHRLNTKITALIADNERNIKSKDSQIATRILSVESDYKAKIDEVNATKTKIISSFSRCFGSFYEGQIEESNIEFVMQIVRKQIESLRNKENRLRNMIGADSSEPIEDAILFLLNKAQKKSKRH